MKRPRSRRPRAPGPAAALAMAGAVLVVAQAAVLAAIAIPAPHSGGDNAAYLALGHALADGIGYVELWDPDLPPHTKYPPGYPLVLAVLMGLGASSWAAFKLASAVALSGATLLVFAWAARRAGGGVLAGAGVALLLVLAGGWQETSRWILSEPWFLLWSFLAFWAGERALEDEGSSRWTVLAGVGALMAFGIRTAGLPVVAALLLGLVVAGRRRAAAGFAAASALVVGGWLLRASGGGEGAYQSEFWLRNPYEPELGTVGLGGLLERVWTNLGRYVGEVLPREWWAGAPEGAAWAVGVLLAVLAVAGWARHLRPRPGPVEIFAPLYAGMILLWPAVWSGDRFLLPLLPLVLLYAGETVASGASRLGERVPWEARSVRRGVLAVGALALALPAVPATLDRASAAQDCRAIVEAADDVFACYGGDIQEFRAAAAWMGTNLPPGAVVLSRKPRILYALGGPRGRTFPFTSDPDRFLAEADGSSARYLLVDRWDAMAYLYAVPVVTARPDAFCYVAAWEAAADGTGTTLLGIRPADERPPPGAETEALERCPAGWAADEPVPPPTGLKVPLLEGRLSRRRRLLRRFRRGARAPGRRRGRRRTGHPRRRPSP